MVCMQDIIDAIRSKGSRKRGRDQLSSDDEA
jgi:hypothetical protein